MSSNLSSREKACGVLAKSLVEEREELKQDKETKIVCSCWSLVLKGLPVVEYKGDAVQIVVLWLHPHTLHLHFSQKKLLQTSSHGLHLAHLKAVHPTCRLPNIVPVSPHHHFVSFECWGANDDDIVIALPTADARDTLVYMLKDIIKVVDVMSRIEDQVQMYLKTAHHSGDMFTKQSLDDTESNMPNQVETSKNSLGWTPMDLDKWLHARQLSSLFVPLNTYLADAYNQGNAYEMLLQLSDDSIDRLIVNESRHNQEDCSPQLIQLRQNLVKHLARARSRFQLPKLFKLF